MRGLQVERLLDLGVRRDEEVRERHGEEERVERQVCSSQRLCFVDARCAVAAWCAVPRGLVP